MRASLYRGMLSAAVLCGSLAGCSSQGEDFSIEGIWNGDLYYATVDGAPYGYQGVMTFRFDPAEGGWACVLGGVPAELCEFDGSAESFHARSVLTQEYQSYTRVRTLEFNGTGNDDEKNLETNFTATYDYLYTDGSTYQKVYTGTAALVRVDRYDSEEASGLRLLGEFGAFGQSDAASRSAARTQVAHEEFAPISSDSHGELGSSFTATANVRVKGDYAFLARFGDGLRVLDISDPGDIREVGHAAVDDVGAYYYNDVKLFSTGGRDYAVLSDSRIGLVVYDVTEPSDPTFVSSFFPGLAESDDLLNNHTVFMVGTTAYLGNYWGSTTLDPDHGGESGGLLIVDLSNPAEPRELGRWLASDLGGSFVHDLYVADGIAYLCSWEIGLVVLDVHDPASPVVLGRFTYDRMTSHSVWVTRIDGHNVAINGDEDFGSHMRVVDVDPDSPGFMTELGAFELRPEVSVHNIMATGSEVVAAYYQDGVRVVDISDVGAPRMVAWYNTWRGAEDPDNGYSFYEGGIGVDVVEDRIYLADIRRGLLVLERE